MINWEISDNEAHQMKSLLKREIQRLGHKALMNRDEKVRVKAAGQIAELRHLLTSLDRTLEITKNFDIICYCDTNYEFYSKRLSVSFRIGDEPSIHSDSFADIVPPPDEYLGIISVIQEIAKRDIKGKVLVITDASRCAIALQMGLRYSVPKHTGNQAPRKSSFGMSYGKALSMTKEREEAGCHIEFSYKHRGFVNEALQII